VDFWPEGTPPLTFTYVNHRGEESLRRVIPLYPFFGSTEFYADPHWLLRCWDLDRQAERDFDLARMSR
jgi:predicted DNA-binding transcriptional regulator YafY